ncbi:3-demethylubiquinone-9 3-O-methyltransferase [Vitreoscilla sp. C1]|uniref:bifunctional 2-polyprenyl-6-hydroxyphenol methylase/3-demethylubiquinol 3-O-methyltransferase UbiG n=1 Tax=Vitreoscilla sp. (strain C1) TaxID=96942 RepID=UPI00148EA307|nr:bifunctional 2-polyprenyl-6-hydroxyphenol methylase/3-demethylubiquinol 3-O-methyltransferase UbiG [Vitreoscilla sp. C1]AUZ04273.2 3-demethylubiquinone-9 3-O-methyltransferase [Vitreoscilla sp. C1]
MTEPATHINVDPSEIEKFSQLAHKWWDQESEFKPLHRINPLRLQYIDDYASLKGKNVVDVGCGGGILTEAITQAGATTLGVDLAEKSLKIAQLHAIETELQNVSYRLVSVEDLAAEQPKQFDVVVCMEMMEHVPDPASVIRSCAQLATDDGWIFFSTINRNPKSYFQSILAAEYIMGLLPRGTHDYKKFVTPAEMARMCRNAGLEIVNFTGFTFNPLTDVYSLCDSIDVNYMAACRKIQA